MRNGFYELVRYLALVGLVFLAVMANKKGNEKDFYIFIALAVLFQPVIKISLGRTLWNLVDVGVAGWLLYSVFKMGKKKEKSIQFLIGFTFSPTIQYFLRDVSAETYQRAVFSSHCIFPEGLLSHALAWLDYNSRTQFFRLRF